jgi:hypothetical protein
MFYKHEMKGVKAQNNLEEGIGEERRGLKRDARVHFDVMGNTWT